MVTNRSDRHGKVISPRNASTSSSIKRFRITSTVEDGIVTRTRADYFAVHIIGRRGEK